VVSELDLTIVFGALLVMATLALGLTICASMPGWLHTAERVVCGLVVAVAAVDLAGYLLALLMGVGAGTVALLAALTVAVTAGILAVVRAGSRLVVMGRASLIALREQRAARRLLAAVLLLGAALAFLYGRAVALTPDGLVAHYNNVWSDWSFHASYTTTFVYGQNLPPQNPLFSGTSFRYPFAPDFASALLMAGGFDLAAALIWPSWAMATLALVGVVLWGRRLCGGVGPGVVAVTLSLLGGGVGFWFFFGDALHFGLLNALMSPPHTYDRFDPPVNIQWYNPILSYYLPQRSFVFGAAIVMAVLLLLTPALQSTPLLSWRQAIDGLRREWNRLRPNGDVAVFGLAGLLAGVLPWFHVHSLVVLGIVTICWAVLTPRPAWLAFAIPVLVVALPRLLFAVPGDASAPAALHYPRLQVGWLAAPDSGPWFWLKNTGAFWPLLLIALLSSLALRPRTRLLLAPFLLVFLVANLVVFQPWAWDNTKVLVFWYLASAIAVAALLRRIWQAGIAGAVLSVGLWLSLVLSGVLSLLPSLPPAGPTYTWFTPEEIQLAGEIRSSTSPHAVFLTGDQPNNPVADLAGRSVLMSYRGWLWSYGIDYSAREADIGKIYRGEPDALPLLQRYQVDYVMVGPEELTVWAADRQYFDSHFPLALQTAHYRIYRVPA
jgi:hypothetical protein